MNFCISIMRAEHAEYAEKTNNRNVNQVPEALEGTSMGIQFTSHYLVGFLLQISA